LTPIPFFSYKYSQKLRKGVGMTNIILCKIDRTSTSIVILSLLSGCTHHSQINKRNITVTLIPKENKTNRVPQQIKFPPITVWIHGTHLIRRPIFYSIFNGKATLKQAYFFDSDQSFYTTAKTIAMSSPKKFPLDTFYIFGWSGKLRAQEREDAAKQLYQDLQSIIAIYLQQYQIYPVIQLITHSHGGNVALNLAKVKDPTDTQFSIASLVLLACPVQTQTMDYICNSIFKQVYVLYSGIDMLQVLAPEIIYQNNKEQKQTIRSYKIPPFSSRRFPLQSHIIQAKIKINKHALLHTKFTSPKFLTILPLILTELDQWDYTEKQANILQNKEKLLCIYQNKIAPRKCKHYVGTLI